MAQQYTAVFKRVGNTKLEAPPYTSWYGTNGITESDFNELVKGILRPLNAYGEKIGLYVCVTLVSCGLCGWCCQITEGMELPKKANVAVNNFNKKYASRDISVQISADLITLIFSAPDNGGGVEADFVVNADYVAPTSNIMAGRAGDDDDDEVVRLEKLKAMLDKGLISNSEYENKKKDILSSL